MKKEQVDAIPLVGDAQPPLPRKKGKVAAEFQEKFLQTMNQGFLQSVFRVFVLRSRNSRTKGSLISCSGVIFRRDRAADLGGWVPPCSAIIGYVRRIGWRSAGRAGARTSRRAGLPFHRTNGLGGC